MATLRRSTNFEVINVASFCLFKQLHGLVELWLHLHSAPVEILAFPCANPDIIVHRTPQLAKGNDSQDNYHLMTEWSKVLYKAVDDAKTGTVVPLF